MPQGLESSLSVVLGCWDPVGLFRIRSKDSIEAQMTGNICLHFAHGYSEDDASWCNGHCDLADLGSVDSTGHSHELLGSELF